MQSEELKPCPFCGHSAHIEQRGDRSMSTIYQCDNCGCSLETGEEFNHGAGWNNRAALESALSAAEPVASVELIATAKQWYDWSRDWSGSAFLNDEPTGEMTEFECKTELYRGLCSLGNHMMWLEGQLHTLAPPAPSVAVKALGWKAHNEGFSHGRMHYGTGAFGHWYGVSRVNTGCWACVHHVDGKPVHLPMTESLDSAKAAAQADYEARILSALSAQVQDESEVIECLLAGKPFVFDPATNFCHADDGGAPEHGIKYVPTAQVQDVAAGVMASIAEERKKQIAKGYDVSHDDAHDTYEIIDAPWGAAARINVARSFRDQHNISGYKAALIQAAAQIVAEIERLDRAAAPAKQEG